MKGTVEIIGSNCTACRACEQVCPKHAITMKENLEGFFYPIINKEKCIECGLCLKKCHTQNLCVKENTKPQFFAVKPIEKEIAKKSTSGGLAYAISNYILENNGIIFGSAYDENLYVKHIIVENKYSLEKLRGSKYVISDTENTFSMAKEKLDNNIDVLYIGTACQIAALKIFLGKDYDNLYTIDIICHGTPNYKLFSKYIKYLEKKYNAKIIKYDFRNKDKFYWGMGYAAKICFKPNEKSNKIIEKYLRADFDPYYKNFLEGNTYRESCYSCKYADYKKRPADITLGDFWGIEKYKPKFYDKNGISLCIVNTKKGETILQKIDNQIVIESVKIEEAIAQNTNLIKPSLRPKVRDNIYEGINKLEPEEFINKKLKIKKDIKIILKNIMPKRLKIILKRYRR